MSNIETPPTNLAHEFAIFSNCSVEEMRERYDNACIDFAGDLMDWLAWRGLRPDLAYFVTPNNPRWRYHAAVILDDLVHDLWNDPPVPVETFMVSIGATTVDFNPGTERETGEILLKNGKLVVAPPQRSPRL